MRDPYCQFKVMHDFYLVVTKSGATRRETRWDNEEPKGNDFLQYIVSMTVPKNKVKAIGVPREEKDLYLCMMAPLRKYSTMTLFAMPGTFSTPNPSTSPEKWT
jgi:hypothetical protein